MLFKNENFIDLNEYTPKELDAKVESYIIKYYSNKNKNKIYRELSKLDSYLIYMRSSGLSYASIKQFLDEYFEYKIGIQTLTDYFKIYHVDCKKLINMKEKTILNYERC